MQTLIIKLLLNSVKEQGSIHRQDNPSVKQVKFLERYCDRMWLLFNLLTSQGLSLDNVEK